MREGHRSGLMRDKDERVLSMGLTIFNLFTQKKKRKKLFSNITLKLKIVMDEFSKYIF